MMTNKSTQILILCLILGCFTSLSIDIFIPGLSHIAQEMNITQGGSQLIVSIFIFGFAITQLIFGFLSDFYGRKKTLLYGLLVYCIAAVAPLLAHDSISVLYVARFFQGVGACSAAISSYAIIRDLYSGNESTKILSYLYTTMVVVSSLAPIMGGFIVSYLSWKYSFVFLTILGVSILIYTLKIEFPSSTKLTDTQSKLMPSLLKGYFQMLQCPCYMAYVVLGTVIFAVLLTFISIAPFVLIKNYGIKPHVFGLLFGVNACFLAIGNYLPSLLVNKIGNDACMLYGTIIMIVSAFLIGILNFLFDSPIISFLFPMFLCSLGLGMITPTSMAGALKFFPESAGQASALAVFIRFTSAMLISSLFALIQDRLILIFALFILLGSAVNFTAIYFLKTRSEIQG
jgi:MFS transporter, DHA1 family, multidrug resistance protein